MKKQFKVNKKYVHFAIRKTTGKIVNGWELSEDITHWAKIDLADIFPDNKFSDFKILSKKHCLSVLKLDVNDWANWEKTNEVTPPVNFIEFEAEIVKERSISPVLEQMGKAKNKMTFTPPDEFSGEGGIFWEVEYINSKGEEIGDGEEVGIGLWFNSDKELTDYDGVFSLPNEAIRLIEQMGYNADYAKD